MPTSTYDLIARSTLSSATSSVTFSGIPSTYRDLVVVVAANGGTVEVNFNLRFNGNTSLIYSFANIAGNTGTPSILLNAIQGRLPATQVVSTGVVGTFIAHILDYTQAKNKTTISTGGQLSNVDATVGMWPSTSAITEVTILTTTNSYNTNATFYLYGIVG